MGSEDGKKHTNKTNGKGGMLSVVSSKIRQCKGVILYFINYTATIHLILFGDIELKPFPTHLAPFQNLAPKCTVCKCI